MKTKYRAITRLQTLMTQILRIINMEAKYQEKDVAKMIIGVETLTVNIVINNIYHIPLYIRILNRSIVKVQMAKSFLFQLAAEEEVDQRKLVWVIRSEAIQELKNFSLVGKEEVDLLIH